MKFLKKTVKRIVPPILICAYKERKYLNIIKNYGRGIKYIKKNQSAKTLPKVVFIIQYPEVWNSIFTVYKALECAEADPLILCIPKPAANFSSEYIKSEQNEAYDFFQKLNIPAVNAYDAQTCTWFDLKAANPDYVMYTRPYNKQYPAQYKSTFVCTYAKICYIPYAYSQTLDGLSYTTFNFEFVLTAYLTFTPSRIRLEECRERFALQKYFNTHKFVFLGFPRFDLLKTEFADGSKLQHEQKTILWLPRWTVDAPKGQRLSSFFKYLDSFFAYMEKHPNVNLIIRPHPLMFQVALEKNILTKQGLDELMDRVARASNICFDENKDYLVSFRRSDVLVSDYTSLLIEYFATEKPIIYCDNAKDFNSDALLMDSTLYHAVEWHDVERQLTELIKGKDSQSEKRKEAIRQLMPSNAGHIGQEIASYIIQDFQLAQGQYVGKN